MSAVVQWVEVDRITEGWVEFVDPQGLAVMTWQTARHLYDIASCSEAGAVRHRGRRFDRDVLAAVVRAVDAAPVCTNLPDGRSMCERPADPTLTPYWCTPCRRAS